jgi:hypothetical protein
MIIIASSTHGTLPSLIVVTYSLRSLASTTMRISFINLNYMSPQTKNLILDKGPTKL